MSIKIKVNLPVDVYNSLLNDMESFNFKKEDNSLNKNKFINTLFKNYYQEFSKSEEFLANKIDSFLKDNLSKNIKKELNYQLLSLINEADYEDKYYYDYSLQFILTKENEKNFAYLEKYYLQERSISKYFRDLLISYSSKSQDKREIILFKDVVRKIEDAIASNKKIYISFIDDNYIELNPYNIVKTKEELYNYLVGINSNNRQILTCKICKIIDTQIINQESYISEKEKELLDKTIYYGAQFPCNGDKDSIVQLTKKGQKLFKSMYLNRPKPYKIEGDIYYFNCSYAQIEFYFFKFGEDALIISPYHLRKQFKNKYINAYNCYKNKIYVNDKISQN